MRVVVVGGAGNFGARIVRALRGDPNIELMVAGRRIVSVGYARSGGQRRPSGDLGSEYVTRAVVGGCRGIARRDVFARIH